MKAQRTCIGCRKIKDKELLIRIVIEDGEPVADIKQVMPGRGCYVCGRECLEKAIKRKAFSRALKTEISNEALGRCFNDR